MNYAWRNKKCIHTKSRLETVIRKAIIRYDVDEGPYTETDFSTIPNRCEDVLELVQDKIK
jgi:hypothetical protein